MSSLDTYPGVVTLVSTSASVASAARHTGSQCILDHSSTRARPTLATTDFGQQLFLLWLRPTLAPTHFGHDLLWPRSHRFWPRSVLGIFEADEGRGRGAREWGGGPRLGGRRRGTQKQKKGLSAELWGPEWLVSQRVGGEKAKWWGPKPRKKVEARRVGARRVEERWGPEGWGVQFFALFSFSRTHVHSCFSLRRVFTCLFSSLWGLLEEFLWCFGRSGPVNVLVFALVLSCERREVWGKGGSVGQNRPGPTKIGPNWPS